MGASSYWSTDSTSREHASEWDCLSRLCSQWAVTLSDALECNSGSMSELGDTVLEMNYTASDDSVRKEH